MGSGVCPFTSEFTPEPSRGGGYTQNVPRRKKGRLAVFLYPASSYAGRLNNRPATTQCAPEEVPLDD